MTSFQLFILWNKNIGTCLSLSPIVFDNTLFLNIINFIWNNIETWLSVSPGANPSDTTCEGNNDCNARVHSVRVCLLCSDYLLILRGIDLLKVWSHFATSWSFSYRIVTLQLQPQINFLIHTYSDLQYIKVMTNSSNNVSLQWSKALWSFSFGCWLWWQWSPIISGIHV